MEDKIVYSGETNKGLKVLIRYPKTGDLLAMLKFINTLSKERTYISFQGEQLTESYERKYLKALLKNVKDKKCVTLCAFTGSQFIGLTSISLKERNQSHIGYLAISISREFREKGLGSLLMEIILKEAKNNLAGLKIVTLDVYANNPIAPSLYKKFGFKEFGRLSKGIKWRDEFVDEIMMYKEV